MVFKGENLPSIVINLLTKHKFVWRTEKILTKHNILALPSSL